jgi:hypothetical protein
MTSETQSGGRWTHTTEPQQNIRRFVSSASDTGQGRADTCLPFERYRSELSQGTRDPQLAIRPFPWGQMNSYKTKKERRKLTSNVLKSMFWSRSALIQGQQTRLESVKMGHVWHLHCSPQVSSKSDSIRLHEAGGGGVREAKNEKDVRIQWKERNETETRGKKERNVPEVVWPRDESPAGQQAVSDVSRAFPGHSLPKDARAHHTPRTADGRQCLRVPPNRRRVPSVLRELAIWKLVECGRNLVITSWPSTSRRY